jgi:hypothetical protein
MDLLDTATLSADLIDRLLRRHVKVSGVSNVIKKSHLQGFPDFGKAIQRGPEAHKIRAAQVSGSSRTRVNLSDEIDQGVVDSHHRQPGAPNGECLHQASDFDSILYPAYCKIIVRWLVSIAPFD